MDDVGYTQGQTSVKQVSVPVIRFQDAVTSCFMWINLQESVNNVTFRLKLKTQIWQRFPLIQINKVLICCHLPNHFIARDKPSTKESLLIKSLWLAARTTYWLA